MEEKYFVNVCFSHWIRFAFQEQFHLGNFRTFKSATRLMDGWLMLTWLSLMISKHFPNWDSKSTSLFDFTPKDFSIKRQISQLTKLSSVLIIRSKPTPNPSTKPTIKPNWPTSRARCNWLSAGEIFNKFHCTNCSIIRYLAVLLRFEASKSILPSLHSFLIFLPPSTMP